MASLGWFDRLPLWGCSSGTFALILGAIEAGYRLGNHRRRWGREQDKSPLSEIVAATLGLVAFLLAFTFGLAANRFEVKRGLILDEANAIGTAFLRTSLLPEPHRSESRNLLREYAAIRTGDASEDKIAQSIARSETIHGELWTRAVESGQMTSSPVFISLYIQSLNEVIDLQSKRITVGLRNRIPAAIWAALYFVSCVGLAVMGYHAGLAATGRSLAVLALVLTFAAVMVLIADLDRPQAGLLRVDQSAMTALAEGVLGFTLTALELPITPDFQLFARCFSRLQTGIPPDCGLECDSGSRRKGSRGAELGAA